MAENLRGIEYLRRKLSLKKPRVDLRYEHYEMKNRASDLGISTPPSLRYMHSVLGWCGKAVDSLADRLQFRMFRNDEIYDVNGIFERNNADIFFDSAILSALISSCSFVYITPGEDGFPRLQVVDGGNATGVIDPITGLLTEGYAVLERDDYGNPSKEAYLEPRYIRVYENGKEVETITHDVDYPLLVPIVYRPDAKRPFGHSRISRACMSIMDAALRTVKRSEISAEFYSFPQRWATGVAQDAEFDKWKATMSSLITFTKDEDGDNPVLGQFAQQSMSPHVEQLRMFAALFAGETGLTLDDLGFSTDNPASSEAIKAAHENLRLIAKKAQRNLGSGFVNVAFLATCLRDGITYDRNDFVATKAVWEPPFELDAAALSVVGDGAIKINQAVPGYFGNSNLRDLTGVDPAAE